MAGLLAAIMLGQSLGAAAAAVVFVVCGSLLCGVIWVYADIIGDYRPFGELTGYLVRLGFGAVFALWLVALVLAEVFGQRWVWLAAAALSAAFAMLYQRVEHTEWERSK